MNYLAHTALSKATPLSLIGNLLGDFMKGVDLHSLYPEIREGLVNHRKIDAVTDQHAHVLSLKPLFQTHTRRFAGVAIDIYFDYLLCKHWDRYYALPLEDFINQTYEAINSGHHLIPSEHMRLAVSRMISQNWFAAYRDEDTIFKVIERAAQRVRYQNRFIESVSDIKLHRSVIEQAFLEVYPALMTIASQKPRDCLGPIAT